MSGQFDLYRDPRGELFLVLQNEAVDALDTRVFASCVPAGRQGIATLDRLAVPFSFGEQEYLVVVNLLGTARLSNMGQRIGNLSHLRDQITRAFDLLYSGI